MIAASEGRTALVDALLRGKASLDVTDSAGLTARDHATPSGTRGHRPSSGGATGVRAK